jgi:hypothetical protein
MYIFPHASFARRVFLFLQFAEEMWAWAIVKVAALVDESNQGFIEPPPALLDEPEAPVNPNARLITVKSIQVLKTGQKGNRKWALTKLIDMDNVSYTTFAGSRYEIGKEYPIEVEEIPNGEYMDLRIKEA